MQCAPHRLEATGGAGRRGRSNPRALSPAQLQRGQRSPCQHDRGPGPQGSPATSRSKAGNPTGRRAVHRGSGTICFQIAEPRKPLRRGRCPATEPILIEPHRFPTIIVDMIPSPDACHVARALGFSRRGRPPSWSGEGHRLPMDRGEGPASTPSGPAVEVQARRHRCLGEARARRPQHSEA